MGKEAKKFEKKQNDRFAPAIGCALLPVFLFVTLPFYSGAVPSGLYLHLFLALIILRLIYAYFRRKLTLALLLIYALLFTIVCLAAALAYRL